MLLKQPCGLCQPLLCEHYRLCLISGISNPSLLVQSVEHIPVEPLPCTIIIMQGELHEGKDDFIYLVLIIAIHIFSSLSVLLLSSFYITCRSTTQATSLPLPPGMNEKKSEE